MSVIDPPPKVVPCGGCNRCTPGKPKVLGVGGDCGLCWLWYHHPGWRAQWGGNPEEVTPVEFTRPPRPDWLSGGQPIPATPTTISPALPRTSCKFFGPSTGKLCECVEGCRGTRLKVFQCDVYGLCTVQKKCDPNEAPGCCNGCKSYQPLLESPSPQESDMGGRVTWAYGVTTVPERQDTILPRTLESLAGAGFESPRLFVDGSKSKSYYAIWPGLEVTTRYPRIGAWGNWILSLYELYIRNPSCMRYVLFQDDILAYRNLRAYLDKCKLPEEGYWNLYTFPQMEARCPRTADARCKVGWYQSSQNGLGALGLVFSRKAVLRLLQHPESVNRPMDPHRGHKNVDGGVVSCLSDNYHGEKGWREYVHFPTLVMHTGEVTTIPGGQPHPLPASFLGEGFDALELLNFTGRPHPSLV